MATITELVIKPRKGWQSFDFREAFLYRELLAFLIWRDIKIRYRQTLLGGLWSILQPLTGTLIFVLVFNRWAGIHSDGPPYSLFAFASLAPWTFFSNSVSNSSNSLITSQQLVSRVYFPRIFIPLGTIGALLLDLALSLSVLGCLMIYYRWAGIHSDGPPYTLFAFASLAPWTFFSNSVSNSSNSLITSQQLVSRVYFPRIFIPLGTIGALLLDLALSLSVLGCLMIYYHWALTAKVLLLPIFILGTVMAAAGVGFAFSALNVLFRDIKYMVPFLLQMGMFVTPVIYPLRYIPPRWQTLFGLNPMSGMVLGFRYCLLGSPVYWPLILTSLLMCLILLFAGLMLFRRIERLFADVI